MCIMFCPRYKNMSGFVLGAENRIVKNYPVVAIKLRDKIQKNEIKINVSKQ